MKPLFSVLIILFIATTACLKPTDSIVIDQKITNDTLSVILVIGQSNTHQAIGMDSVIDASNKHIKQLGRFSPYNMQIIEAKEPLDHFSKLNNTIGFALTFAKNYRQGHPELEVLIIPGGKGQTGFKGNDWNKGDTLYEDAIYRTNHVLSTYKSKLIAILWHQGENDVTNINYQDNIDSMIVNLRKDIIGDHDSIPFILGGMVPYWVDQDADRKKTNQIIEETPNRIHNTAYADPRVPYLIEKVDNEYISIHYDAIGIREMGNRYFMEYLRLINAEIIAQSEPY